MKEKIFEYVVEGKGYFPMDMLRYDRCWPANDLAVTGITETRETDPNIGKHSRKVKLQSIRLPTYDRWLSFGWEVQP